MTTAFDKDLTSFGPVPGTLSNRFIDCPIADQSTKRTRKNLELYKNSSSIAYNSMGWQDRIPKNFEALNSFVPLKIADNSHPYETDDGVWMLVIDIIRIKGKPHFFYYGNHNRQETPYEPWSSAKLLAASAAVSKARYSSQGKVGAQALVGDYSLGDIITTSMSYQHTGNVETSSNQAANFLLRSAGESYATDLLDNWILQRDGSSFYGKFGRPTFDPGSNVWKQANSSTTLPFNYYSGKDEKAMSLLSIGEWIKRLAMHKADPNTALPFLTDLDIETFFYGDPKTAELGGAHKGTSAYIQKGLTGLKELGDNEDPYASINEQARDSLNQNAGRNWRVFLKNGAGPSTSRNRGEVTLGSYVCLPELDGGREFILVARSSIKNIEKCSGSAECYDVLNEASELMRVSVKNTIEFLLAN
ncbi:hypothetical protein N9W79_00210 [bacterium]|nr:hypothetical protein [bacterium]